MCIAIYSKRGNALPTKDILNRCYKANPDGAGFAYNFNGTVYVHKGFFDFEKFYQALSDCDKRYNLKEQGVLLHFRIATHGDVDRGNCHPFPLTDKTEKLKKPQSKCRYAVIHNGIISCTSSAARKGNLSDTALFVRDYLVKLAKYQDWFVCHDTPRLIHQMIDSKMAILNHKGEIIATEGFHKGTDGNYYSNYSYQESLYDYGFWEDYYGFSLKDTMVAEDGEEFPLMRLRSGEAIQYDNGSLEEYRDDYHRFFPTFTTMDGDVYALFEDWEEEDLGLIPADLLSYMGAGKIIDPKAPLDEHGIRFLDFRADSFAVVSP